MPLHAIAATGLPVAATAAAAAVTGFDPTTIGVLAISAGVLGWYFVGTRWNRRLGGRAVRWLGTAWAGAGEGQVRWVSGNQVQVGWDRLPSPWRRAVATVMLEPRESLLVWGYRRYRGHGDVLVLRGHLATAPRHDGEVDLSSAAPAATAALLAGSLKRLVLHRTGPHVACELDLTRALSRPAAEVLGALAALGAKAAAGGSEGGAEGGAEPAVDAGGNRRDRAKRPAATPRAGAGTAGRGSRTGASRRSGGRRR